MCKTLLQTRGLSDDAAIRNARGLGDAFKIIYTRHGLGGFARGMTPRVLTNMPSNALCCASCPCFSPPSLNQAARLTSRGHAPGLSYEGFRFFLKGGHNKPPPVAALNP